MKRLLLSALFWVGAASAAFAQVNVVPQTGLITGTLAKQSYRGVSVGLVPAASATDILCISGSANKLVKVTGVALSGTAGTLTTVPVVLLRRAAANTAGTLATGVALPVAGRVDSSNGSGTATLAAWTANPTITDSSPVLLAAGNLTTPTVAAATNAPRLELNFGANLPQFTQQAVLRGAAQQLCVNLQGTSISSGVVNITVGWTEE